MVKISRSTTILTVMVLLTMGNTDAVAGDRWSVEAVAAAGLGHVFRFQDQTFGNGPEVAGGVTVNRNDRLGVDIRIGRVFGLSPELAPCGVVIDGTPAVCRGVARNGVFSATVSSMALEYRFTARGRLQPYLAAGLGILSSRSVWSTATVQGGEVVFTELIARDTGLGPEIGGGLRLHLTRTLSIAPDVRWLDASVRSRLNLAVTRVSVRVNKKW